MEGIHLNLLTNCIEKGLQNLLITLKQDWLAKNVDENNFFNNVTIYKELNKQQKNTVDTIKDITKWDVTLCSLWLNKFEWDPVLGQDVQDSIKILKDIRNKIVHKHVTSYDDEFFKKIKDNLGVLQVLSTELENEIDTVISCLVLHEDTLESIWPYTTNKLIGGGSFSIVLEVQPKIGTDTSAVKLIFENNLKNNADREAKSLVRCFAGNHKNVVKYISSGRFAFTAENLRHVLKWDTEATQDLLKVEVQTKRNIQIAFQDALESKSNLISGLYLSMELCGETLRDWLNDFAEGNEHNLNPITLRKTRQRLSSELIDGLNHIHDQDIIHRDLRPPNIFFAKSNFVQPIKIGDFGLSKNVEKYVTQTATRKISHEYCGPEIHDADKDGRVRYSQAFDYYALGLIISEIFDPVNISHLNKKKDGASQGVLGPNLNDESFFKQLVLKLMSRDPDDRYFRFGTTKIPLPRIGVDDAIENTVASETIEKIGSEMDDSIKKTVASEMDGSTKKTVASETGLEIGNKVSQFDDKTISIGILPPADIKLISLTMKDDVIAIFNASKIAVSFGLGGTFFQWVNEEPENEFFERMLTDYQDNPDRTNEASLLKVLRVLKIHSAYYSCSSIIQKLSRSYNKQCQDGSKYKFKILRVQLNEADKFTFLYEFCTICRAIGVTKKNLKSFTKLDDTICKCIIDALEPSKTIIRSNARFWGLVYWLGLKAELKKLSGTDDFMTSLIIEYARMPDATVEKLIKTLLLLDCNEEADLVQKVLKKLSLQSQTSINAKVTNKHKCKSWNNLRITDYLDCHKHNEEFLNQLYHFLKPCATDPVPAKSDDIEEEQNQLINAEQMAIQIANILGEDYLAVQKRNQIYFALGLSNGADFHRLDKDAGNDDWVFFHTLLLQYFNSRSNAYDAHKQIVSCLKRLDLPVCATKVETFVSKVPDERYFESGSIRLPLLRIGMDNSIGKTVSSETGKEIGNEMNDSFQKPIASRTEEQIGDKAQLHGPSANISGKLKTKQDPNPKSELLAIGGKTFLGDLDAVKIADEISNILAKDDGAIRKKQQIYNLLLGGEDFYKLRNNALHDEWKFFYTMVEQIYLKYGTSESLGRIVGCVSALNLKCAGELEKLKF